MAVEREDPYAAYNFLVEIEGVGPGEGPAAGFSEVSGLDVEVEAIEYRNGNDLTSARKVTGMAKYGNITLKRGVICHLAMWDWVRQGLVGRPEPHAMVITLLDEDRSPVLRWQVRGAIPLGYRGPRLDARADRVALEAFIVGVESFDLD